MKLKRMLTLLFIIVFLISAVPTTTIFATSTKVSISQKTALVVQGDYLYLTLKGTTKKVTWSTNNKYVATVSKKGKVSTVGTGKATITAKVGNNKYACKVSVIKNSDPSYLTDTDLENALAERNAIDDLTSPDDSEPKGSTQTPKAKPSNRNIDGIVTPEIGEDEASVYGVIPEWIGNEYLSGKYGLTVSWLGEKIYIIKGAGDSFIITGSPKGKLDTGVIYECKYNDITIRVKYDNELLINTEDLRLAGIIK